MSEQTFYLGRTRDTRERVYVTIHVQTILNAAPQAMVDHSPASDFVRRLSITGQTVQPRARTATSAGQILDVLPDVEPERGGWTEQDIASLHAIWQRWHLNDMRAACAHMDLTGLGSSYDERKHVTCPETGERYGSRWWSEEIPDDVWAEVRRLMALPTGHVPDHVA